MKCIYRPKNSCTAGFLHMNTHLNSGKRKAKFLFWSAFVKFCADVCNLNILLALRDLIQACKFTANEYYTTYKNSDEK